MVQVPDTSRIGFVTDLGRVDEDIYIQLAHAGFKRAATELGLKDEVIESTSLVEYESNVETLIDRGCGIIVTTASAKGAAVERLRTSTAAG